MIHKTSPTPERSSSTESALLLVEAEIECLGLVYSLEKVGIRLQSVHCELRNRSGYVVSVGSGKGLGDQSVASAMFEALEHYFTSTSWTKGTMHPVDIDVLFQTHGVYRERVFQLLREAKDSNDQIISRRYTSAVNSVEAWYPAFLSVPDYAVKPLNNDTTNYLRVFKYATNNGTAIGTTQTEAILHATCELIERDALSLFLINTFLRHPPKDVTIIDPTSLPNHLMNIRIKVEQETGQSLVLLELTTDIGVPSILAYLHRDQDHRRLQPVPHFGMGSSLCREYAFERAMLEALQSKHLCTDESIQDDISAQRVFSNLPGYERCAKLDIESAVNNNGYRVISYECVASILNRDASVDNHLKVINNMLDVNGFRLYFTTNYESPNGISCVHCCVPGLERFHLVRYGKLVLPSHRGSHYLTA